MDGPVFMLCRLKSTEIRGFLRNNFLNSLFCIKYSGMAVLTLDGIWLAASTKVSY